MSQLEHMNESIPKGSVALFFIQTASTLGFAVLYSTLVLYATNHLHFPIKEATAVMGVFGAFNYGLHLFGGYLGGRFLCNRNLFVGGMVLAGARLRLIALGTSPMLYWGLALFLTGSGLNVTCINMMLTQRFAPEDERREGAFLWNYAGMNIGFFIGFTVAGHYQLTQSYASLFVFATVGNFVAIVLARSTGRPWPIATRRCWRPPRRALRLALRRRHRHPARSGAGGLGPAAEPGLDRDPGQGHLPVWLPPWSISRCSQRDRARAQPHVGLPDPGPGLAGVLGAVSDGAERPAVVRRQQCRPARVGRSTVAPQWVQNINTVVIVVGGPLMAAWFNRLRKRGWKIDIPMQFSVSLLLMGLGFLALPAGIPLADAKGMLAFVWLFASYVLQSIGELLISPIGYAMIGKLAPRKYQGIMMGSWMLVTGLASLFAGDFSGMVPEPAGTTARPPTRSISACSRNWAGAAWRWAWRWCC